jgi:hypothetical protein
MIGLRFQSADGSLSKVRCKSPNKCDYCARLTAQENALVVLLDAQIRCPTVSLTTTTRDPDFGFDQLRKAEASLWRWLRREYPELEYLGFVEWTTGKQARDGRRRAHIHHLVKGLPVEVTEVQLDDNERLLTDHGRSTLDFDELEAEIQRRWKKYTGDSWRCDCEPIRTPVAAMKYLAGHHYKLEQAPPPGFRGKRLRPSIRSPKAGRPGYFELPIVQLRELARRQLADDRLGWAVEQTIEAEVFGRGEYEADKQLKSAVGRSIRDLGRRPAEVQLDLAGRVDGDEELAELVRRTVAEAGRDQVANPPKLVRVRERPIVDAETGEILDYRVVEVLGEVA